MERKPAWDSYFNAEIYLIDESNNPSGTVKDRKSKRIVEEAIRHGIEALVCITNGNDGYSLGLATQETGIKVVSVVKPNLEARIKRKLAETCELVDDVDICNNFLTKEKRVEIAREATGASKIWDVTNENSEFYSSIVDEIVSLNPKYLVVPGGSFNLFVGLHIGIQKYRLRTRLIGVTVYENPVDIVMHHVVFSGVRIDGQPFVRKDPMVYSGVWLDGLPQFKNAGPSLADKLDTPYTPWATLVKKLCRSYRHKIIVLYPSEIPCYFESSQRLEATCEPSASVIFCYDKMDFNRRDTVVLLNTGRGLMGKLFK